MLIHPSRSRLTGTLANFVLGYYQKTGQNCAFHPITRLDRDTFGVVLLAKNSHVHAILNETHNQGLLQKTYHALVYGGPDGEEGTIDAPIARRPLPSLLRYVNQDGKPSLTKFRVLERFAGYTKLALQPVTGRTHQLRVHCAHRGFPILGDPQYGTAASQALSGELGYTTQQLCAKTLEFTHPLTGQCLCLESAMEV
jgi:23S rRNA pseudouridine1911/1915/1917 synthase